ncbi:hypothetical protein TorRG33x02_094570 [Trema orientale]|uniref:Uncharacterized protein n=1 Tax=Trema orientale TaxID=63057 RepID=A0A2P5FA54_TREOI|nr:hypothetical protein TorRG33x02_094570 [Trema orientale]
MKRRRKGRGDRRSSGHGLLALLGAAAASEDGRFGRLAGSGSYRQWRLQKLRRRMLASTIASACGGCSSTSRTSSLLHFWLLSVSDSQIQIVQT